MRCAAPSFSSTPKTLPPIDDPDEFYDHQLEGLRVRDDRGRLVGTVDEVLHTAAGELFAVRQGGDGGEVLVPFVSAIVTAVSLENQTIEIDPPEGLLELELTHAYRRGDDLPRLPGPAAAVVARQGD